MSKVLIIHHLEPMWNPSYWDIGGTNFDDLQERVAEFIESKNYDQVILTRFEDASIDASEYWAIYDKIDVVKDYAYGWEAESFADEDEETGEPEDVLAIIDEQGFYKDKFANVVCRGGNHSEVVMIAGWMEKLPKTDVDICGAFDGECIEDLEIALDFLNIKFNRIEDLII